MFDLVSFAWQALSDRQGEYRLQTDLHKSATEGFYLTVELTACLASAQCQTFSLSCSNGAYRLLIATMILTP